MEEEAIEIDMNATIAEVLSRRKGKKNNNKKPQESRKAGESLPEDMSDEKAPGRIQVSKFDDSVENHCSALDTISKLCGQAEFQFDQSEVQRLSSSITFLREWMHFSYQPRIIRFACQSESPPGKDVIGEVNLSQFSAAEVPKKDQENGSTISSESSKDFVMYVGGPVWALDWCPTIPEKSDCDTKVEFIAVAAHPPDSSYHKIGALLTGRGMIQIWSLLNFSVKEENPPKSQPKKPRGRPRKTPVTESVDNLIINQHDETAAAPNGGASGDTHEQVAKRYSVRERKSTTYVVDSEPEQHTSDSECIEVESTQPKKAIGRPRKKPRDDEPEAQYMQALAIEYPEKLSSLIPEPKKARGSPKKKPRDVPEDQYVQPLAIEFPKMSCQIPFNEITGPTHEQVAKNGSSRKQASVPGRLKNKKSRTTISFDGNDLPVLAKHGKNESSLGNLDVSLSRGEDPVGPLEMNPAKSYSTPKDVVLPRVVLCLAHNGKVAWDVKWRPMDSCDAKSKHRMGYLAVLLGNGALEVWEIPSPNAVRVIYSASQKEGTDPRFVKLDPVFRCYMLKSGDRQSIPLTVEWSASPPHDLILAGCHDGVVALWKFSANGSFKDDTRPLLCFSADTAPIRALAWAPTESDPESANIIVTAGHKGLKFWDLRDPFRPLYDLNTVQRVIYSLDWLPDPRCIMVSFDDGTIRILSLSKAAYDAPVTGRPFVGTQQQGFHSYYCSSYTIWSIQVSRLTGMVAYCGADGNVLRFQLTTRAVEKDPLRNRAPHFLIGSLTGEEESTLTVNTPLPDIPFPMKKSLNEWSNAPRTIRGFLSDSNQEKRAKEEMAKGQTSSQQTLAVCYGDDPRGESGPEDILAAEKSKKKSKNKLSGKKVANGEQTLVCGDDDPDILRGEEGEKEKIGDEIEVMPSKMIAMHRVRWNMNKGSQRWLCYGGASGIIRCQEIN